MRLLLATAVAVLKVITASADDNTIFKQHGSVQYVDNFLSPEESKHFYDTMESLSQVHPFDPTAKYRGNVMVSSFVQRRLKDVAGSECSIDDDMIDTNGGIMLQTRIINKSTKPHIDYEAEGKVVEDDVMFITLNSNPEAHFNHGGNSLPAVAGRLVRFAGNAVHGTTHNGGDPIRLLGPFSIKNFASVGGSVSCAEFPTGICIEGEPSSGMISQPFGGSCDNGFDISECYEIFQGSNCPSGTGVCIFEGGSFVDNGDGTPCSGSTCYKCTNRAGTCSSEALTSSPTSSPTQSKSGKTTSAKSKSVKTSKEEGPDLDDLQEFIVELFGVIDANDFMPTLGAMLEDIGGGRRILENKEDIKTLLISLLDEKMDEY